MSAPAGRAVRLGWAAGTIGLLLFGLGVVLDPTRAYFSYLTAYTATVSLALGALVMVMLGHLTGAGWLVPLRRIAETAAASITGLAVLFLPVVAGMDRLYPWVPPLTGLAGPVYEAVEAKRVYLEPRFFLVRAAVYFAVWIAVALALRRKAARRQRALSAVAMPAVALTLTFAAFDWMMSLSPAWFSTIYGVYVFAGGMLAALALVAAAAPAAARAGSLGPVPTDSYHALGKLLLTFAIFWFYVGFSQFLIIWIANVPSEAAWYVPRLRGSWLGAAVLLVAGQFVIPFLLLLFRRIKRSPWVLASLGGWLLLMHYLDAYWLVMPELDPAGLRVHWLDFATLVGVGGATFTVGVWLLGHRGRTGQAEPA